MESIFGLVFAISWPTLRDFHIIKSIYWCAKVIKVEWFQSDLLKLIFTCILIRTVCESLYFLGHCVSLLYKGNTWRSWEALIFLLYKFLFFCLKNLVCDQNKSHSLSQTPTDISDVCDFFCRQLFFVYFWH